MAANQQDPALRITPHDDAPPRPLPSVATEKDEASPIYLLAVIIPARNEAASLPACLASLIAQSEPGFALGQKWQLIVVDDHSTDDTRSLATRPGVTVLSAPPLDTSAQTGFTGKTNACWAGAQAADAALLLFTDADTIHEPGSLSRARHELEKYGVALLSYSPRQLTSGVLQRIVMPLVFAELATAYPMPRVNAADDRIAAANGQFILVESEVYFAVGGHRAIGREVLEDVALAHNIKRSANTIRFRYAPDALSTRMYRTTADMLDRWRASLALLFTSPLLLALFRTLDLLLLILIPIIVLRFYFPTNIPRILLWVVWARVLYRFMARTIKSNFPILDCILSILGLPLFIYLLIRSYFQVKVFKSVTWKGRTYRT